MTPIQQLMLGVGASKKTYLDDVFATNLWTGDGVSNLDIVNGIDLATEGGMVLQKRRGNETGVAKDWMVWDSLRKNASLSNRYQYLQTNTNSANIDQQAGGTGAVMQYFNTNGFRQGADSYSEGGWYEQVAYSFRKAPGFFDVVTYTGNNDGTNGQNISHNLGSVPGLIFVKKTSSYGNWFTYHKSKGKDYAATLDTTGAFYSTANWDNTEPTSTHFRVKHGDTNNNGSTYIAYVFAGGESTADKAVEFDGTGDYLTVGSSSDYTLGTGDFTIECWAKFDDTANRGIFQLSSSTTGLSTASQQTLAVAHNGTNWHCYGGGGGGNNSSSFTRQTNKWYHLAFVRYNGTTKLYVDGTQQVSFSDSYNYSGTYLAIGGYYQTTFLMDGKISNFRVVKGEALYTSQFAPLTHPVTRYSSTTKLLCCDGSSTTASTVVSGTITANGDPTVTSNNSIFDDPAGFVFGESGSESVIKCGSYVGNANADGPDINLGWEPQWILLKDSSDSNANWALFDSMRGIVDGGNDMELFPNTNSAEDTGVERIKLTPTGFKIQVNHNDYNHSTHTYIYMAIRRPDGYVQKPQLATGVFAMDTGNNSSTIPAMDSGFPVDMALYRQPASTEAFSCGNRLMGTKYLVTATTATESNYNDVVWDSNAGFLKSYGSNYQAWMWKRHAGFDVVAYKGSGTNAGQQQDVPHSMNKTPEMMWVKIRDAANQNWMVYHKGLNGGTNPGQYKIELNSTGTESSFSCWDNTAPNATSFRVGNQVETNHPSYNFIAMLFASVNGISKVGSYTGNGSESSGPSISLGFQPRFILFRGADISGPWRVLDTLRDTLGSGTDKELGLNNNYAEADHTDWLDITSTGFDIKSGDGEANASGKTYIYYAHA